MAITFLLHFQTWAAIFFNMYIHTHICVGMYTIHEQLRIHLRDLLFAGLITKE